LSISCPPPFAQPFPSHSKHPRNDLPSEVTAGGSGDQSLLAHAPNLTLRHMSERAHQMFSLFRYSCRFSWLLLKSPKGFLDEFIGDRFQSDLLLIYLREW